MLSKVLYTLTVSKKMIHILEDKSPLRGHEREVGGASTGQKGGTAYGGASGCSANVLLTFVEVS